MNIKNKLVALSLFITLAFPVVSSAQTPTVAQLQAQLQSLFAQIKLLQQQLAQANGNQSAAWCHTFNANLGIGNTGPEVQALQTALQKEGLDIETSGSFDETTASIVSGFQQKYKSEILAPNGLKNGTGYVGKATRVKLNALYGCVYKNSSMPQIVPVTPSVPIPASNPTSSTAPSTGTPTLIITRNYNIVAQSQLVTLGGTGYVFLVADITADSSADVMVSSVNFGCGGFACNKATNLTMVMVGGSNPQTWTGSSGNPLVFTTNLLIPRGTTRTIKLIGDVSPSAPVGQEMRFALTQNLVNLTVGGMVKGDAWGDILTVHGASVAPSPVQATFDASPSTISSGESVKLSWYVAIQGGVPVSLTATCVAGITMYDVTSNATFSCGDLDRQVSPSFTWDRISGYKTIKFTSSNVSPTQVTVQLDYGSVQPLTRVVTVNPPASASSIAVSLSPTTFNFSIAQGQSPGSYPNSAATFTVSPNQLVNWTWSWSPPGPASWVSASTMSPPGPWVNSSTQSFISLSGATLGVNLGTAAANLAPGTYTGTITVSPAPGTSPIFTPQTVTVNLTVTSGTSIPTATISANPTTITQGQSTTITWSSNFASSCTPSNAFGIGTMGSSGSFPMTPSGSGTFTYTVTCTGPGGASNPASVDVTVNPPIS